ncbi:MAG TPA: hypothetical protein ENN35_09085 [Deltaproteobacteria bacterium]|nr:hypothetical protein [Deltaproteobacteria bacterium]
MYAWERMNMEIFFNPLSVAVVGASNNRFNLASTICGLLKSTGYDGAVVAVNPKGEDVHGCPGYRSVGEIPHDVDLAVILVQASSVPDVVRQCGEKGIRRLVIESAGFAENGEEGRRIQENIDTIAERYGIRYLGPNCLGTLSTGRAFCCFFGVWPDSPLMEIMRRPGAVSYVIQSGGLAGLVMESLLSDVVGINKVACIGNKADIDEGDLVTYFEGDGTEVIGMYLENVHRGRKFFQAASCAVKPLLVYKAGSTKEGVRAVSSHTAGMANNDVIFDRACAQAGIIRLRSIVELYSLPKIFVTMPPLKGKNVAVFTNSGAFGGISADFVAENGLSMVRLSPETKKKLRKAGHLFNADNPVDLGPGLSKQSYLDIYEILLSAPEVDGLLPIPSIWQDFIIDSLVDLLDICRAYNKPAAIYVPSAVKKIVAIREEHRLPLFESPEEAVRALAVSLNHFQNVAEKTSRRLSVTEMPDDSKSGAGARVRPIVPENEKSAGGKERVRLAAEEAVPYTERNAK